ncbi:MAG: lysine 2,3-aminomutase [Deltaproteobacteria bacterium]|nr:lysine 2,3-aminomutase [Deltaproteobacteria bacterium]
MKLPYINNTNPLYFQKFPLWNKVSREQWMDYKWQMKNTITTGAHLQKIIPLSDEARDRIDSTLSKYKFAVTPYWASLIDEKNPECPFLLQAVPTPSELSVAEVDLEDPLGEDVDSPVPGLTHRYPDRVLVLITSICSLYCRFCTRRRLILDKEGHLKRGQIERILEYIGQHREIRDVILSGGDAVVTGSILESWLKGLRAIPHVEIIRIASKVPCVMPMRITDELARMIKKYQPVFFMTHFNHPFEITPESAEACARLVDHGIPVMNQTVLLRKINSDPVIMKKLMQELLRIRVKPYYIYQCDLSEGLSHFRTPLGKGIEIIEYLRGHTSGLAVPEFVVDMPGGGGKVPVMPNYLISHSDNKSILRNYEGLIGSYPEPEEHDCHCSTSESVANNTYDDSSGVSHLFGDSQAMLEPHEVTGRTK